MGYRDITLDVVESVAVLTLNRPEMLNATSPTTVSELLLAMDEIEAPNSTVRCVLLTGAGRAFCSGPNLRSGAPVSDPVERFDAGRVLESHYHPLLRRIRTLRVPFITAVNGASAGVGVSLALMGDMVLCSRSAFFLHAFRHVGLVPDGGSTWLLPRLVGRARAMELSLLGERLAAETALEWGLINRVYDDDVMLEEARKLADRLAKGPTVALALTRRLYWESGHNSYEDQINLERRFQRVAGDTADFTEGIQAFAEKRSPRFEGR